MSGPINGTPTDKSISNSCSLLKYRDRRYIHPRYYDVRKVLRLASLTGSTAGDLVGVSGRTVRKWTARDTRERDPDRSVIPYAAWRLLLIETDYVEKHWRPHA